MSRNDIFCFSFFLTKIPIDPILHHFQERGAFGVVIQSDSGPFLKFSLLNTKTLRFLSWVLRFKFLSPSEQTDVPPGRTMYFLSGSDHSNFGLVVADVAYNDFITIKTAVQTEGQSLTAIIDSFGNHSSIKLNIFDFNEFLNCISQSPQHFFHWQIQMSGAMLLKVLVWLCGK